MHSLWMLALRAAGPYELIGRDAWEVAGIQLAVSACRA